MTKENSNSVARVAKKLSLGFNNISGAALLSIVLITFVDVFFRAFGYPIMGRSEIVGFLLVIAVCLSFARTEVLGVNTSMEFLKRRLSARGGAMCDAVANLLSLVVFALLARQCFVYAGRLFASGEITPTLKVPFYPLVYVIALGVLLLCFVLLGQLVESVKRVMRR